MADDKRTKIGSVAPARQTGNPSAQAAAVPTPAPIVEDVPSSPKAKTSYLPPQADPLVGQTMVGRYLIQKKLGEGGMGAVYLATHLLLEKSVALKVLHSEFARKDDLVERFMQEAKAASRIRHENVIDISDFGKTDDGLVFFAMELLNGHDLHEEIARARLAQQLLPWERSKKIFLQICAALSAAHGKGIIHRDLKPENVYLIDFLGDPDFVKLLDFGIAKLTEVDEGGRKLTKTGMLFGTPEYMSPEQAKGEPVDNRVDVYAMGCILFQLVTGRVPFEAENFMGVLSLHLTEPAPSIPTEVFDAIGAPHAIGEVIDKSLQKDRNARYTTIDDFANAVRMACGEAPVVAKVAGDAKVGRSTGPANIPAPSVTTERNRTPTPAPPTPKGTPATSTQNRVRTQWTGSLSVPTEDEPAPKPRPRKSNKSAYLMAGGIVLVGVVAAAVLAVSMGQKKPKPATGGEGSGPTIAGSQGSQVVSLPPTLDAGAGAAEPTAPLPPPPDSVELRFESDPKGATITDLSTNIKYKPGTRIRRKGSNTSVQYLFELKGYSDAVVELTPNQDIKHVEKLEKGVSGTKPKEIKKLDPNAAGSGSAVSIKRPDAGSAKPPDAGSAKPPDAGSAKVPEVKPPDPAKPKCDGSEIPPPAECLKDPTRDKDKAAGSGSGTP